MTYETYKAYIQTGGTIDTECEGAVSKFHASGSKQDLERALVVLCRMC